MNTFILLFCGFSFGLVFARIIDIAVIEPQQREIVRVLNAECDTTALQAFTFGYTRGGIAGHLTSTIDAARSEFAEELRKHQDVIVIPASNLDLSAEELKDIIHSLCFMEKNLRDQSSKMHVDIGTGLRFNMNGNKFYVIRKSLADHANNFGELAEKVNQILNHKS